MTEQELRKEIEKIEENCKKKHRFDRENYYCSICYPKIQRLRLYFKGYQKGRMEFFDEKEKYIMIELIKKKLSDEFKDSELPYTEYYKTALVLILKKLEEKENETAKQ
jgi:hypothetical protein